MIQVKVVAQKIKVSFGCAPAVVVLDDLLRGHGGMIGDDAPVDIAFPGEDVGLLSDILIAFNHQAEGFFITGMFPLPLGHFYLSLPDSDLLPMKLLALQMMQHIAAPDEKRATIVFHFFDHLILATSCIDP